MMGERAHIVIAGGGMIGGAAALVLGRAGCRVSLLEPAPQPGWPTDSPPAAYGTRVCAISLASVALLQQLEVWPRVVAQRVSPFRGMQIWSGDPGQALHFDSAELGQPELGFIVENDLLSAVLWEALGNLPEVTHLQTALCGMTKPRSPGSEIKVRCSDGVEISADLLIAADGARSLGRILGGFASHWRDFGQSALVARVETTEPHQETAYQRFLAGGPLAFLPLADGSSSIVWSQPRAEAEARMRLLEAAFRDELQAAFGNTLGAIGQVGPRSVFPLMRQHADRYEQPGVLLLGDAAHSVHPLAGQGVNLGFADIRALQSLIAEASGSWCRDSSLLRRFGRQRRAENSCMIAAMEGLKALFSRPDQPRSVLISKGLGLVDQIAPLKRFFISRAGGVI
ncbi:MAG: FAD-dependent monooxygenase [Gammaproteobacteria bacterium]|nr:FAD-dependent monooxygenase [Gammaproteobacteria bacterium]